MVLISGVSEKNQQRSKFNEIYRNTDIQSIKNTIFYFENNLLQNSFYLNRFKDDLLAFTWLNYASPGIELWDLKSFDLCYNFLLKYKNISTISTSNQYESHLIHNKYLSNHNYIMRIIKNKQIHSLVPYIGRSNPNNEHLQLDNNESTTIYDRNSYALNLIK